LIYEGERLLPPLQPAAVLSFRFKLFNDAFGEARNDLVVPFEGSWGREGSFP
jgi:hypothetical protein